MDAIPFDGILVTSVVSGSSSGSYASRLPVTDVSSSVVKNKSSTVGGLFSVVPPSTIKSTSKLSVLLLLSVTVMIAASLESPAIYS